MDIDYDTEQSLFSAPDSSSSEQMAMVLSMPTQRRLIRKPLPDLPQSQGGKMTGGQSVILGRTASPLQHSVSLEKSRQRTKLISLEEQKQLDWWPSVSRLKDKSEPGKERVSGPYKMNELYNRHLLRIIKSSLKASGRPSNDLAKSIFDALQECIANVSTPESMYALHQSYSFLWRIEALIRSDEEADYTKASKVGGRWPRLPGWKGSVSSSTQLINTDARRKKRDIALQLLGSALRFNGGGNIGHLEEGIDNMSDDKASKLVPEKVIVKRTSGSAPQLLVKSSMPTIALQTDSGTEEIKFNPVELDKPERASVLTSRLAMQLKNSAKVASEKPEKSAQKDEEATITVCRICLDYEEEVEDQLSRRRRSGTVTTQSCRLEQNASQMSTASDRTIREQTRHNNLKIVWKPDQFTGSPLHLNPLSSEVEGRDRLRQSKTDSQLKLVGGTFMIESVEEDREYESVIREVLNISLYAACAMMMESSLLRDLALEEEVEEIEEKKEQVEINEDSQAGNSLLVPSTPSEAIETPPERLSRWSSSIWGMLHYPSTDQSNVAAKIEPSGSPGSKNRLKKGKTPLGYLKSITGKRLVSTSESEAKQKKDSNVVDQSATQEVQSQSTAAEEAEGQENESAPLAISPYCSDQATETDVHWEIDEYKERLLSHQSIILMVLEGMDLLLSVGRQQLETTVQRVPLITRHSFAESTESATSKTEKPTATPSHSSRSASQGLTVEPNVKLLDVPILTDSAEKSQREVQFYLKAGGSRDLSLGQAIEEMAAKADLLDKQAMQPVKKSKEVIENTVINKGLPRTYRVAQYLHGRDRISVMAHLTESGTGCSSAPDTASESLVDCHEDKKPAGFIDQLVSDSTGGHSSREDMKIWSANVKTGEETAVKVMSDATYLGSYGSFLQSILSHPKLARERHDIVLIVQFGKTTIKFVVQPIVVFDLLVEGPVVCSKRQNINEDKQKSSQSRKEERLIERTRGEIQNYFSSVKRHVSALEHLLVARELDERGKTLKRPALSTKSSISSIHIDEVGNENVESLFPCASALKLLSKLKKAFREAEFELYDLLKMARPSYINDVRIRFESRAKSTKKRLSAWEVKHLNSKEVQRLEKLEFVEPEYFEDKIHSFPGSRYLFREEEPLSMIAYTLSSREFDTEMNYREQKYADVLDWRTSVIPSVQSQLSASINSTHTINTATTSSNLDPDEDLNFDSVEPLQIKMKRKKRTKDAGILSLTLKRANSDFNSQSGHESDGQKNETGTAQAQSDTITPTASVIASSKFDTLSSTNDTFRAEVTHLATKTSLGSMFEGNSTALLTPSGERSFVLPSDGSSSISRSTTRESSESATLSVPVAQERRSVSQPIERLYPEARSAPISPHIKHSIVTGNLKISCVSWFAEDFSKLRKLWNMDEEYIQSMARCQSRSTMGGKSKSGFYVTLDGNWIAKQLLNVWSIDEKEAFLEFAPAYLRYMMHSTVNDCPTLLVKIAGVYTLKIKDVKTGEVKLKMSVQVLENVFAGDSGDSIRFDVKGIRDRRVQLRKDQLEEVERAPVWWDGEWIDSFQPRAFVPSKQKIIFQRALNNDLAFLTGSNVMDYSLLIGAQEKASEGEEEEEGEGKGEDENIKPTFRVRIVDFLGAFTLVKALESSGKRAMKSQAPTIIPPNEYAARFKTHVKTYFTGCPV